MVATETGLVAWLMFLLTWGILNFFWLAVLRRPALSAALSLALACALVLVSRLKYDVVWMTADFLDLMIIDTGTAAFLMTIYSDRTWMAAIVLVGAAGLVALLWGDPRRMRRRHAVLACGGCLMGLIGLSSAAPGNWYEVFSDNNYVSKFSRSGVTGISEWAVHGLFESDAVAAGSLASGQDSRCNATAEQPHIILIHDESSYDIRVAPGIKVPPDYGPHFRSFDGRARKLLVESNGGASWFAEFNVLTGLSSRSFGRFSYFLPRVAAGRVGRGLPLALRRCGYGTFSFYPAASAFMSAKSFHTSTGIEKFFDYRDMGAKNIEPDSFYYTAAATRLRHDGGAGPMFAFIYLAANHFPYSRNWRPDLMPDWRDPGNTPEVDEYLRRQAISVRDYHAFLERLRNDFPGEPFLIVRYGDHQPAFPTNIMGPLDEADTALKMRTFDPKFFATYYAIDTINYRPIDMNAALDMLDAPFLPLVIQDIAGLPLDASFAEQKRIFARCDGIFYGCAGGAEARRFNRLLIDAGLIKGL